MVKNSQYFEKNLIMLSSEFNKGYFTISGWLNKSFNLILSWSFVIELILLVSKFSGAIYGYNYIVNPLRWPRLRSLAQKYGNIFFETLSFSKLKGLINFNLYKYIIYFFLTSSIISSSDIFFPSIDLFLLINYFFSKF